MSDSQLHGYVVAGVVPGSGEAVVARAVEFADRFGTGLVCVIVEPDRVAFTEGIDGTVLSYPLESDELDAPPVFDAELEALLRPIAEARGVPLATRALTGEPAHCLGRFADRIGAPMIVVGSREAGLRGSLREFFAGSVALHLTHRQQLPVVVVPLSPVTRSERLPWEHEL